MEQSKFKYILSPENTYIIDFGDFVAEVTGAHIMDHLRRELYLEHLWLNDTDTSKVFDQKSEPDTYDAGL
jgi:hypothetical protein